MRVAGCRCAADGSSCAADFRTLQRPSLYATSSIALPKVCHRFGYALTESTVGLQAKFSMNIHVAMLQDDSTLTLSAALVHI
jgi:hypothetical protein